MMDTQQHEVNQQANQYLTTEHFTLQTACNAIIAEVNGRITLFLGAVSSAVVALAFVGQVSQVGDTFFTFGLVLLPSLICLGLFIFLRLVQVAVEDDLYAREINRIRHFYVERSPEIKPYLLLSTHDDERGILENMGLKSSVGQGFFSSDGMVAFLNSLLMGVFLSLLVYRFFHLSILLSVVCGLGAFLLSLIPHQWYQSWRRTSVLRHIPVRFPSPESGSGPSGSRSGKRASDLREH
jgi:hypothetical protein